ncbi:hypothetical protein PVAP13_3KG228402 [Panicum virgatum]|uniref:Ubiquitin-like protease family profile domain-containing protein n=1 Tax=Panicum virgatum TaxID=38727 RepID=A0A8T0V106_PANVG|nr:hypothetical protein PVAP13_3KG228402 [Panicum virgatum]
MIIEIVKRFEPSNQSFKICGQDIQIQLEDVKDIMGLPIEGKKVFSHKGPKESVLFTIGVILAPTTKDYVHSSYLPVVMEISEIPKFNWGEFTLKYLTNSCNQYNYWTVAPYRFWYWERVIAYSTHGINYEPIQPPLMARWNEDNANRRWIAFLCNKLDGGTKHLFEEWANDTRMDIGIDMERNLLNIEHRLDMKIIEQKMEDRLRKIEDDTEEIQMDIKELRQGQQEILRMLQSIRQSMVQPSTTTPQHFQRSMPTPGHVEQPTMPIFSHDQPIIDKDYKLNEDDHDAAAFIQMSYEDAKVVKIGNMVVRAKQLFGNVKNEFIGDDVIDAFAVMSIVETGSASYINTFEARILCEDDLDHVSCKTFRERMAEICNGRHLVFVPMHLNGNHWALLVLNFKRSEIQILNSIPRTRNEAVEKKLVSTVRCMQGIQTCIDCLGTPINLSTWKTVSYLNIPLQTDGTSCGAFILRYIQAWDGEQMAYNFSNEEQYYVKYPEQRPEDKRAEDDDVVQVVQHGTRTPSTPAVSTKQTPGTTAAGTSGRTVKRRRGRPRKETHSSFVALPTTTTSTPGPTGSMKRKPGRPRKITTTPQTPASTVVDEFSIDVINKRLRRLEP